LWVRDEASKAKLICLRGHTKRVLSVGFSPDGRRILSRSLDWTTRLWDTSSGNELDWIYGREGWIISVGFSPDGKRIVSGAHDRSVRVWDADNGAELACLRGHQNDVTSVAYSLDGSRIVSGSADNTVRIWDAVGGAELACLLGHMKRVISVAFSLNGRWIFSRSVDDTVRVWDAAACVLLEEVQGLWDLSANDARANALPWRALSRELETVIVPTAGGNPIAWLPLDPIAWFPIQLMHKTTHPFGRSWAGAIASGRNSAGNYLCIIKLEGNPDQEAPAGSAR
jgi:hypothetical protein